MKERSYMPATAEDDARWYAVHTRSNFEKRIAAELGTKGIVNYLPAYEEVHQWKDRKRAVLIPLFPGYVFARFSDEPYLRLSVLTTAGVVRILGCGGAIEAVPDGQVEAVRRLLLSKIPYLSHPFLREGDWVRVKCGPLRGIEGILVRAKSRHRLVISVPLLSQSVAAEIDGRNVEPIQREQASFAPEGLCTRI